MCVVVVVYYSTYCKQTSAQREHDKNVSAFVRSMYITQRKIVSNCCFRQCSNKYYTLQNNRNALSKNLKNNL